MNILINPGPLSGEIAAVPSKSDLHRKLICAALADSPTTLPVSSVSRDIAATVGCLRALGADIKLGDRITVSPINETPSSPALDCGESGSSLRFLLPVAAALGACAEFSGCGRLPQRPVSQLIAAMEKNGVRFSSDALPLRISGRLRPGVFELPGDVSSQYVSGLLMALPLLDGDSVIRLTSPLQSAAYTDITVSVLKKFGVAAEKTEYGFAIPGNQRFVSPGTLAVDGDWSNSAFFLAAGALGGAVTVTGLDMSSPQGDKKVIEIMSGMGCALAVDGNRVTASTSEPHGIVIDASEVPDLVPALAVAAAFAEGESWFVNAARLRAKESDRLASVVRLICGLGGRAEVTGDVLTVFGGGLAGGTVDACGDHRIVMAAASAAVGCKFPVTITGAEAVGKSYPGFFEDYAGLCTIGAPASGELSVSAD